MKSFACSKGVKQGWLESPLLFAPYLDEPEKGRQAAEDDVDAPPLHDQILPLIFLMFANDNASFLCSGEGLQAQLDCLADFCKRARGPHQLDQDDSI